MTTGTVANVAWMRAFSGVATLRPLRGQRRGEVSEQLYTPGVLCIESELMSLAVGQILHCLHPT